MNKWVLLRWCCTSKYLLFWDSLFQFVIYFIHVGTEWHPRWWNGFGKDYSSDGILICYLLSCFLSYLKHIKLLSINLFSSWLCSYAFFIIVFSKVMIFSFGRKRKYGDHFLWLHLPLYWITGPRKFKGSIPCCIISLTVVMINLYLEKI